MNTIITLLGSVQAAQDDALEAAPHPSSKPFREAKQALKNSLAELRKAIEAMGPGWIPIDASLPDDDTLVLVATSDNEVWPAYRDGDIWRWGDAMPVAADSVTHWMHLPAAPFRSAA